MKTIPIIVPAYNPPQTFIPFVKHLTTKQRNPIIVVNDGSHAQFNTMFQTITSFDRVHVVTHKVNKGKGEAIKTALLQPQYSSSNVIGYITVDADGQHAISDITHIQKLLINHPNHLILGVRMLSNMPLSNRIGNTLSSHSLRILFGKHISDTQTGLRAIPKKYAHSILSLPGKRYEYETIMLLWAIQHHIPIKEVPIQTIYTPYKTSHYKSTIDTLRIAKVIASYFLRINTLP